MKVLNGSLLLLLFVSLFIPAAHSQSADLSDKLSRKLLHETYLIPWSGEVNQQQLLTPAQFLEMYSQTYLKELPVGWELIEEETDELNMQHVRYQQLYEGVEVLHGKMILHVINGAVASFNGEIYNHFATETPSGMKAMESIPDAEWEDVEDNIYAQHPNGAMYLCKVMMAHRDEIMQMDKVFVSASSDVVVRVEPQIIHADSKGRANTHYIGVQNVITDSLSSTNFRLRENARPIRTFKTSLGADFTDSDNYWNNTGERIAGDVHYGAQLLHTFFKKKFGWNSYANNNDSMTSVMNLTGSGNAYWNLSGNYATFLAGSSGSVGPCASIDVVGHEFGHGVADENAGLVYSGESCMLHESLADITGTLLEWYHDSTKYNWLLGENVWSGGIRNMRNPKAFNHPDTYKGTYFPNGCHGSGGVQNYWFYLMVKGDTGTNDANYAYSLPGMGFNKAMAILYRAVFYYWTSNTTFAQANTHALQAAKDIYGSCSDELRWTYEAWKAVGLEDTSFKVIDRTHKIISPKLVCSVIPDTLRFTCQGDPNRTVTWYFSNGDSSKKITTDYIVNYTGLHTYRLKTEICNLVFWDTGYTTVNYQPVADFAFAKTKACYDGVDSVKAENKSINFDKTKQLSHEWIVYPYGDKYQTKNLSLAVKDKFDLVYLLKSYYPGGCWDTISKRVSVFATPTLSMALLSSCEGDKLKISNQTDTSSSTINFVWKVNNKDAGTNYHPNVVGSAPGIQSVNLKGTDVSTGCWSQITQDLTVYGNPKPTFKVINPCSNQNMLLVHTTQHTAPPNYFRWHLPTFKPFNKDTLKLQNDQSASIVIGLEYKDQKGCFGFYQDTIDLENVSASFALGASHCELNQLETKAVVVSPKGTFYWVMDDNILGSDSLLKVSLTQTGKHQLRLVAVGTYCKDSLQREFVVHELPKPEFEVLSEVCAGETTYVTNLTDDNSLKYTWQWGDGDVSDEKDTSHRFKLTNIYQTESFNVSLKAINSYGCEGISARTATVNALSDCQFDYTEPHKYLAAFDPKTNHAGNTYKWHFGDGDSSTEIKPQHQYDDRGTYQVRLDIMNNAGCFSSCTSEVEIGWGLSSRPLEVTWSIAPNPTYGMVEVLGISAGKKVDLKLVDVNGKVILTVQKWSDGQHVKLPLNDLASGMYYLQISDGEQNRTHRLEVISTP